MLIMEMNISDVHLHLETWKGGSWMCQQVKETMWSFQNYFDQFFPRKSNKGCACAILFSFQCRSKIDDWDYEILRTKYEIDRSSLSMALASVNNQCLSTVWFHSSRNLCSIVTTWLIITKPIPLSTFLVVELLNSGTLVQYLTTLNHRHKFWTCGGTTSKSSETTALFRFSNKILPKD